MRRNCVWFTKRFNPSLNLIQRIPRLGQALGEYLRELINVSQLALEPGEGDELQAAVTNADCEKCERCWRWEPSVGSHDNHATLCTRCVEAVN